MFLPITKSEVNKLGWNEVDFVLISGDAYIDHPSFGATIIGRVLHALGYKVALLPQPDVTNPEVFRQFGSPRLGFLITAGNIDSMVNHYTVAKKRREKDFYTPGGIIGKRPDDATIRYSQLVRQLYPETAIILGGIEASLRRMAHYDYVKNKIRPSILIESKADLVVYGMADKTIVEIAEALKAGLSIRDLDYIRGTVYFKQQIPADFEALLLPSFMQITQDKTVYANSFYQQYRNTDAISAKVLIEPYSDGYLIQNKPALPLTKDYFDWVYGLDYQRSPHPSYQEPIPAIEEVQHSIIVNRGCFGNCSFCALSMHQGRVIQSRSKESVVEEAKKIIEQPNFKGYIHDIGGPTANFYHPSCEKQEKFGTCIDKPCLHPTT